MATHFKLKESDISSVKSRMQRDYNAGGYFLPDPHFEIGRQLHINNYYYAKQFFRSIENCRTAARLLFAMINKKLEFESLTFIGVGDFFGPVLFELTQLIVDQMSLEPHEAPNYVLVDNTKSKYSILFNTELRANALIVLPVTCTFGSAFQAREIIEELAAVQNRSVSFVPQIFTVFLVVDSDIIVKDLQNVHTERYEENDAKLKHQDKLNKLYKIFGWESTEGATISLIKDDYYRGFGAYTAIRLETTIHKAEECEYCYSGNPKEVKALFPTKINHDTPDLIFALPKFKNTLGRIGSENFQRNIKAHKANAHLFGHLRMGENSYLHFIERDTFYENNKNEILDFFDNAFKNQFDNFEHTNEEILIITPSHQKTSTILEDLLTTEAFEKKQVTIIHTNPYVEFIENFLHDTEKNLDSYERVFFFDYVISGGKTFKILSDYLKYVRKEKGFDALFCIIDRTTEFSKKEILRKLTADTQLDDQIFMAYFKLNLPITDAESSGNPILQTNKRLVTIFEQCHLDTLKAKIQKKYLAGKPLQSIEDLRKKNAEYKMDDRERYQIKLFVCHEISAWFYRFLHNRKTGNDAFGEADLANLINSVTQRVANSGRLSITHKGISEIVVKTLTHSPFKHYKDIYLSCFKYVNQKLYDLVVNFGSKNFLINDPDEYQLLRFYMKRSIDVGSNYILSKHFFSCIKGLYENRNNDERKLAMPSIILFYKELNHNNHERALKFEELINDPDLLPSPIANKNVDLRATFSDRFYQLGRILKAENVFPLNELKNLFIEELKKNDRIGSLDKFIEERYFSSVSGQTNIVVRNAQSFIKRSKENNHFSNIEKPLPSEILRSVKAMLKTVALIKKKENETRAFYENIAGIISEATKIIIDDEIEFAFCIEFTERRATSKDATDGERMASNIYTILSTEPDAYRKINISKKGLAYKMLYGLVEESSESPQTFLALAKDETGYYISFKEQYRDHEGRMIRVSECLQEDITGQGTRIISDKAGMVLLFRLAEFDLGEDMLQKGQAVLVISNKEKATTERLAEFINIEKLRLLLLIKEDLLEYLRQQFGNDAFIGLQERLKELEIKSSMEHMVGNYFEALDAITRRIPVDNNQILLNFIHGTIYRHIRSISKIRLSETNEPLFADREEKMLCSKHMLRDLFDLIADTPNLARKPLPKDCKVTIECPDFICPRPIYEQVIPELMINIRRYSMESRKRPIEIAITFENNRLIFSNDCNPLLAKKHPPNGIKPYSGTEMCNNILASMDLPILIPTIDIQNLKFTIILDLNEKNSNS
ncbi:hypothetical protein [Dyadobacter sp. BHUBP1]|uniref:hypothetical protein n=1 Tax=Dyadobacter sp. BHUBP1 TaxID=3424178 RepID=UPI003D34FF4B